MQNRPDYCACQSRPAAIFQIVQMVEIPRVGRQGKARQGRQRTGSWNNEERVTKAPVHPSMGIVKATLAHLTSHDAKALHRSMIRYQNGGLTKLGSCDASLMRMNFPITRESQSHSFPSWEERKDKKSLHDPRACMHALVILAPVVSQHAGLLAAPALPFPATSLFSRHFHAGV